MENLLKLTNGVNGQLTDVQKQLRYISKSTTFHALLNDYRRVSSDSNEAFSRKNCLIPRKLFCEKTYKQLFQDVVDPIFSLTEQIGAMSRLRMNVSESTIRTFTTECQGINSPRVIANVS